MKNWSLANIFGRLKKHYGYIQNKDHNIDLDKTVFNDNYAWRLKGLETIDAKEAKGGPMNLYYITMKKRHYNPFELFNFSSRKK